MLKTIKIDSRSQEITRLVTYSVPLTLVAMALLYLLKSPSGLGPILGSLGSQFVTLLMDFLGFGVFIMAYAFLFIGREASLNIQKRMDSVEIHKIAGIRTLKYGVFITLVLTSVSIIEFYFKLSGTLLLPNGGGGFIGQYFGIKLFGSLGALGSFLLGGLIFAIFKIIKDKKSVRMEPKAFFAGIQKKISGQLKSIQVPSVKTVQRTSKQVVETAKLQPIEKAPLQSPRSTQSPASVTPSSSANTGLASSPPPTPARPQFNGAFSGLGGSNNTHHGTGIQASNKNTVNSTATQRPLANTAPAGSMPQASNQHSTPPVVGSPQPAASTTAPGARGAP